MQLLWSPVFVSSVGGCPARAVRACLRLAVDRGEGYAAYGWDGQTYQAVAGDRVYEAAWRQTVESETLWVSTSGAGVGVQPVRVDATLTFEKLVNANEKNESESTVAFVMFRTMKC